VADAKSDKDVLNRTCENTVAEQYDWVGGWESRSRRPSSRPAVCSWKDTRVLTTCCRHCG